MFQQDDRESSAGSGVAGPSDDVAVGKSTLVARTLADGSGAFTATFMRADEEPTELAPDPPARNLDANKAEIAAFGQSQPPQGGAEEAASLKPELATGGDSAPVSPELAKSIEAAQGDTKAAVATSQTDATAFKTTMESEQTRFEAEQNATTLEQLKAMSPTDKRSTLKEMGYDAKDVQKLKDSELDGIIEGKIAQENRKNTILGMDPDERAKLSPEQKTQFLQDLGIDRGDLDQAGPGRCAQCFDDVMRIANVPGQHKVTIQIKSGFLTGKSWDITVKTDADGNADFSVDKKGGFFSKLLGWIKAALPIILTVLAPLTAGVSLVVLAVYQTVTAIMAGDWLGAVLGIVGAIAGVSAFMAARGLTTAASALTKIADVASKVGKVAQAAQAAMSAAKAKNAGSLLGALAAGAAGFAAIASKAADAFAARMNDWSAKLKQWSTIVAGGEKVVQGIQKGDPLAAVSGAFDTAGGVVAARTSTEPAVLQRAANITSFVATSKRALTKSPADYGAVAAAALGIAGELQSGHKLEDAAKIVSAANRLKLAWDNRETDPGALSDAAFAVAEAVQTAKYDATNEQTTDESGKPLPDADRDAITARYQRAARIVSAAAAILTAATAKPRPNYVAALSAATTLASEFRTDQRVDEAAAIMSKLDAWTIAIGTKDEAAIAAAGRALGQTIDGLRGTITKDHDDAKQAAEAKLAPGETLADDGGELPAMAPPDPAPLDSTQTVEPGDGVLAAPPDPAPAPLPRLQLGGSGKASTPGGNYTVLRGDTLSAIATRFDVTVDSLLADNPQLADNMIYERQKLFVPGADQLLTPRVTTDTTFQIDPAAVTAQRSDVIRRTQTMINTMNAQIRDWNNESSLGADFYVDVRDFSKQVDSLDNFIGQPTASTDTITSQASSTNDLFQRLITLYNQRKGLDTLAINGGIVAAQLVRDGAGALISALGSRVASGAYQGVITAIDELSRGGSASSIAVRSALAAVIEAAPEGKGVVGSAVNEAFRELANTVNEYMAEVAREPEMTPQKKRELQLQYAAKIPTMFLMGAVKGKLDFADEKEKASEAKQAMDEMLFKLFKTIADVAFEGSENKTE